MVKRRTMSRGNDAELDGKSEEDKMIPSGRAKVEKRASRKW